MRPRALREVDRDTSIEVLTAWVCAMGQHLGVLGLGVAIYRLLAVPFCWAPAVLLHARSAWSGVSWGPGYETQWSAMRVLCALDVVERIVVEEVERCTPYQLAWVLDGLPANKIVLQYSTAWSSRSRQ